MTRLCASFRTAPVLVLAAAGILLGACGGGSVTGEVAERIAEQAAGEGVDIETNDDGGFSIETENGSLDVDGAGNANVESEDGSFSIESTAELPDDFPDIPLPENFAVQTVTVIDEVNSEAVSVAGTIPGDGDDATTAYEDLVAAYEAAGYTTEANNVTADGEGGLFATAIFTGGSEGGVSLSIIAGDGIDTMVSIVVSPNI